jgi:hypothetical protein
VDEGPKLRAKSGTKSGTVLHHSSTLGRAVSPQSVQRLQLVSRFVEDLFPLGRNTVQHSFIGTWLWNIPQRAQWSDAMELAAECLALAYFAKVSRSKMPTMRSREVYALALDGLSKDLESPVSRLSSETLCATLLLIHYEVGDSSIKMRFPSNTYGTQNFLDGKNGAWITHAGGVGRLVQLRGAHRHTSAFDYSMFLAARGYIVSVCLFLTAC